MPIHLSQQLSSFFVSRQSLWREEGLYCALSGGADSIALALLLEDLHLPFTALHCNFHLRGEESEADEQFVREFCSAHHIPLRVEHFDVAARCASTHESVEMAARALRYEWFAQQGGYVCVAHHADDQAETLLLNLLRGTGLRGLAAMKVEHLRIWRPLLNVSRQELRHYLQEKQAHFVEDSTNQDTHFKRNWVRHRLIPLLSEQNPSISASLSRTAEHCRQALSVYQLGLQAIAQAVQPTKEGEMKRYAVSAILALADAGEVWWREVGMNHGFSNDECMQALQSREGFLIISPTHELCRQGDYLLLSPRRPHLPTLQQQLIGWSLLQKPSKHKEIATIDAEKVVGSLHLRPIETGDKFQPFGMRKGTKLVSDYLTDRHRSRIEKNRALVVCDDVGIVWLVGETIAQRVAISDHTNRAYQLQISEETLAH